MKKEKKLRTKLNKKEKGFLEKLLRKPEPKKKTPDSMESLFPGGFEAVKLEKVKKKDSRPLKTLEEVKREEKEGALVVSDVKGGAPASPDPFFGQEGFSGGVEEGLGKLLNTVTDPENVRHFTQLDHQEVIALSAIEAYNQKLRSPTLARFCAEFREHRVSTERKGRGELVEIARAMLASAEAKARGFFGRIGDSFR